MDPRHAFAGSGEKIHRDNRGYGEPKTGWRSRFPAPASTTHSKKNALTMTQPSTHALIGAFSLAWGDHQATNDGTMPK